MFKQTRHTKRRHQYSFGNIETRISVRQVLLNCFPRHPVQTYFAQGGNSLFRIEVRN